MRLEVYVMIFLNTMPAKIHDTLTLIKSELDDFYHIIDIPSVMDRTQNTGIISKE